VPGVFASVENPGTSWGGVVLAIYLTGIIVLVGRMIAGGSAVRRIVKAVESHGSSDGRVLISQVVAVPLVVGVWRPRIVVPPAWTSWSDSQKTAVIAHEQAHIARRDGWVLRVSSINCCLFWFHPLAWWLRRQLAITAEQACDEAAVIALGARRPYAELLLDMARHVRRHRGRLAWSSVGMDGPGTLDARIDRVLSGEGTGPLPLGRRVVVVFGCALAVGVAAACRQADAVAPLLPDPVLAAEIAEEKATQAKWDSAKVLTAEQVAELEAKVAASPEDMDGRRALITFYNTSGHRVLGWDRMVPAKPLSSV
jgi:hypothetical protein